MITELPIKAGQNVHIAISALNTKKEIWGEDADVWRPERWLEPLPNGVTDAKVPGVYSSLMTFLGGGRACMYVSFESEDVHEAEASWSSSGFKFSEMEMSASSLSSDSDIRN